MSGQVINLNDLYSVYGQCCLPRSVLGDLYTPIVGMAGANGKFFVSNDPTCADVITGDMYPMTFEYIFVCNRCPLGGCLDVDYCECCAAAAACCCCRHSTPAPGLAAAS